MRLAGKVAIVTGSTAGIGKGAAVLFAKEGAKVVVSGRTVDAGERVVEDIRAEGGDAIFVKADVSQAADVQRLVKETVSAYGKLDVLFNNAGTGSKGLTADESEESWDRCITINLKSVFLGIKFAVPEMIRTTGPDPTSWRTSRPGSPTPTWAPPRTVPTQPSTSPATNRPS